MAIRDYFSDDDLAEVRKVTKAAEGSTSGELVCVIVERSDAYDGARWRAATLGGLAGALLTAYGFYAIESWSPLLFVWPAVVPLLAMAGGWLLSTTVPALERELAGAAVMKHRVHDRAASAFVSEQVFRTRDRTGVLIFLSLFERRVEVLCDEGIRRAVPTGAWSQISAELAAGIGAGEAGPALVKAIEACGRLLAEAGLEPAPGDVNELSDDVRILDD